VRASYLAVARSLLSPIEQRVWIFWGQAGTQMVVTDNLHTATTPYSRIWKLLQPNADSMGTIPLCLPNRKGEGKKKTKEDFRLIDTHNMHKHRECTSISCMCELYNLSTNLKTSLPASLQP